MQAYLPDFHENSYCIHTGKKVLVRKMAVLIAIQSILRLKMTQKQVL